MKKKDKKRYKRKKLKIKDLNYKESERLYQEDTSLKTKTKRKTKSNSEIKKSNLNLKTGRVVEIFTNYSANIEFDDGIKRAIISGNLKQFGYKAKNILIVGDFVKVDTSNELRIEEVLERRSKFSRFTASKLQKEIIFASNIDQIIITSAFISPRLDLGFIDRCIIEARLMNINPIICVNKTDLIEDEEILDQLEYYSDICPIILTSAKESQGLNELREILKDKDSIFLGKSGVGKSSLINRLQSNIVLQTGEVCERNNKGIHVTTSSKLIKWDFGGHLVDTPGVKTMSLPKDSEIKIPRIFPRFAEYYQDCKFNDCTHTHEIKCAVIDAVENEEIPFRRYESYLRILLSVSER